MDDRRRLLSNIQRDAIAQRKRLAETAFERKRLEYLLYKLGLKDVKRELTRLAVDRTGSGTVTFDMFAEVLPTFPVYLGTDRLDGVRLHADKRATLPALFNQFAKAPFVAAYERFYEQARAVKGTRAVGLLFPRNRVLQGMVIHNGDLETYHTQGTAMVYRVAGKKKLRLVVQPFTAFVAAVYSKRHDWMQVD